MAKQINKTATEKGLTELEASILSPGGAVGADAGGAGAGEGADTNAGDEAGAGDGEGGDGAAGAGAGEGDGTQGGEGEAGTGGDEGGDAGAGDGDGDAAGAAAGAGDEEGKGELDAESGLPKSVQKRIDTLTAQKKGLEEKMVEKDAQLAELQQKLEAAGEKVHLPPSRLNPLQDVNTEEQLNARVDQAKRVKRWCLENLEGGEVPAQDGKGEPAQYDAQQVRQMLANADDILTEHVPARRQFLVDQAKWDAETRKVHPDLFNGEKPMFKEAVQYLKALPELMRFPDWKMVLGDFIVARNARLAREKQVSVKAGAAGGAGASKPAVKLAPKVPGAASSRQASGGAGGKNGAVVEQARSRIQSGKATVEDQNAVLAQFV